MILSHSGPEDVKWLLLISKLRMIRTNITELLDGGCGYVLKPEYLTTKVSHYSVSTSTYETNIDLKMKLLSGQHLGKDVMVTIKVLGHPVDTTSWTSSAKTDFCPVCLGRRAGTLYQKTGARCSGI